jgi:hypothetical protein
MMDDLALEAAYRTGVEDWVAAGDDARNPYEDDPDMARAWQSGRDDARQRELA